MSDTRWTTSNKAVYNIGYHLIWCPKYRRKVLVGAVAERLKELLIEKAQSIDKTRLPTLWTRSYYCESVGHISQETVRKYIEEQKSK